MIQQFEPPIRRCSVRCSVEVSKYGKMPPCGALFAWGGSTGTSTLTSHIERAHPSVHSELMMVSSQESREERKDAVMITGEGWCLCPLQPVFCFHVQVRTAATPVLAWRYWASFKRVNVPNTKKSLVPILYTLLLYNWFSVLLTNYTAVAPPVPTCSWFDILQPTDI